MKEVNIKSGEILQLDIGVGVTAEIKAKNLANVSPEERENFLRSQLSIKQMEDIRALAIGVLTIEDILLRDLELQVDEQEKS